MSNTFTPLPRRLVFGLVVAATSPWALAGMEPVPVPGISVSMDFGSASLTGNGRLLRAGHVPVQIDGNNGFFTLEMEFQMNPDGSLGTRLISAAPVQGPAQDILDNTLNFQPGNYSGYWSCTYNECARNSPCLFTVTQPVQTADGRRLYTLRVKGQSPTATLPAACPDISAQWQWQTGPAAGNTTLGSTAQSVTFTGNASSTYGYGFATITGNGNGTFRVIQNGQTLILERVGTNAQPNGYTLVIDRQP